MGRITVHPTSYGSIKVIGSSRHVHVGKYTSIADGVKAIMVGHNLSNVSLFPFNKIEGYPSAASSASHPINYGNVEIGNDCWIGYNVTIIGGVKIGDGASVGSCALVSKDIAPYSLVGGVPARILGMRFREEIISKLLEIRWWDWDMEKIRENAGLLCSERIDEFIQIHLKAGGGFK